MGIFFILSVSDTIFAMPLLPKQPRTTWRTTADHSLRSTYIGSPLANTSQVIETLLEATGLKIVVSWLPSVA
jgi:hypothetical protein